MDKLKFFRATIKLDLIDKKLIKSRGKDGKPYKHAYYNVDVCIDETADDYRALSISTYDPETKERTYIGNGEPVEVKKKEPEPGAPDALNGLAF